MSTDADSAPPLVDDVAALRAKLATYEVTLSQQCETIQKLSQSLAKLEQELARLLKRTYGPKSERVDPDQLLLFDPQELEAIAAELVAATKEEAEAAAAEAAAPASDLPRPGHGRKVLPESLPREQKLYELTDEERKCPCCGEPRTEIDRETSEQLEYVPASYKVIEHVRVKYACKSCQENVTLAPKPPQPVEKGLPGPGLLAQTVLSKYGDHTPLYRQEDIAARHGITLRRSTLCGWIAAAADLALPLYQRIIVLLRQSFVIHTDDTSVKLLDPLFEQARTARFWAYVGDANHPYSVFDFTDSRGRDGPEKFLAGYQGYLQADAYGVYDGIYAGSRGTLREVACWAHARRYWHEARTTDPTRAHTMLGFIARLYQIERQAAQASRAARQALRQQHALPLLKQMRAWLDDQSPRVLPKSPVGQALGYTLNQWDALQRYTEDGWLAIDNNISERTVKLCAIGRKNWLFVASQTGGRRAAILFSLIASAKANQVEPWAWLRDVFTRLPNIDADDTATLDQLLPDRWLLSHPNHRWQIDQLRKTERQRQQNLRQKKRRR
jgi:transposase